MNLKEYLEKQIKFLESEANQATENSDEKTKFLFDAKIDELHRINKAVESGLISNL
ncbi:hypothetical protein [Fructilactobacillus lindneri]|nr:hypothetical protein [Fructilactobacillus lindneri]SJZ88236.1 hypothetical protein SAMN02746042_00659 [Fructilactobacillus lindneri DSM 20690 = JCM 11027]